VCTQPSKASAKGRSRFLGKSIKTVGSVHQEKGAFRDCRGEKNDRVVRSEKGREKKATGWLNVQTKRRKKGVKHTLWGES